MELIEKVLNKQVKTPALCPRGSNYDVSKFTSRDVNETNNLVVEENGL